ncbi:MAG: hypothetical protein ACOC6F_03465 [bacterium]
MEMSTRKDLERLCALHRISQGRCHYGMYRIFGGEANRLERIKEDAVAPGGDSDSEAIDLNLIALYRHPTPGESVQPVDWH